MEKETDKQIRELQMIEQNVQQYLMQKQQFQSQLIEIESAISALSNSNESYKIVGNIMIKTKKDELEKDLKEKKDMFELRIKTLEKQENKLKDKAKDIQKEVLKGMKDDK